MSDQVLSVCTSLLHTGSCNIRIPTAGIKVAQRLSARINSDSLVWLRPHVCFTTTSVGINTEKATVQQLILGETFFFFVSDQVNLLPDNFLCWVQHVAVLLLVPV